MSSKTYIKSADADFPLGSIVSMEFCVRLDVNSSNCASSFQDHLINVLDFRKKYLHSAFTPEANRFYDDLLAHLTFEEV